MIAPCPPHGLRLTDIAALKALARCTLGLPQRSSEFGAKNTHAKTDTEQDRAAKDRRGDSVMKASALTGSSIRR
jgi:hypothetical protein